jgi:hypothetical protein
VVLRKRRTSSCLASRWFTRIRERYDLKIFRGFFKKIVEMCFEAGSVRGEELFFDSAKVKAP